MIVESSFGWATGFRSVNGYGNDEEAMEDVVFEDPIMFDGGLEVSSVTTNPTNYAIELYQVNYDNMMDNHADPVLPSLPNNLGYDAIEPDQDNLDNVIENDDAESVLSSAPSNLTEDYIKSGQANHDMIMEDDDTESVLSSVPSNLTEDYNESTSEDITTDGDLEHRPFGYANVTLAPQENVDKWLNILQIWWDEDTEDLDQEMRIPDGYRLYIIPRKMFNKSDKYLYGHPGHHRFRSPAEFYPHLRYLIDRTMGKTGDCDCMYCGMPSRKPA